MPLYQGHYRRYDVPERRRIDVPGVENRGYLGAVILRELVDMPRGYLKAPAGLLRREAEKRESEPDLSRRP